MGKFRRSWQQGFNAGVEQQRKGWRIWYEDLDPEVRALIAEREGARRQRSAFRFGVRYPGIAADDCSFLWS